MFAFGLFATDIFVNAGQVVTGNLAPYFLTVCKPNYTGNDCRTHHQFISNGNICTGDVEVIEKARRSFPSKHAALSIYSALYATVSRGDDCWLVGQSASYIQMESHSVFLKEKRFVSGIAFLFIHSRIPFPLCYTSSNKSKPSSHCFCSTM